MGQPRQGQRKLTPETIECKERAVKAVELRKNGLTFRSIAEQVGYNSPQAAYDAVKRLLRETLREPADELRTLELERLDAMWQAHYLAAQAGDVQAIGACMKLMERRARLLGLDAPEKKDVTADITARSLPASVDEFV